MIQLGAILCGRCFILEPDLSSLERKKQSSTFDKTSRAHVKTNIFKLWFFHIVVFPDSGGVIGVLADGWVRGDIFSITRWYLSCSFCWVLSFILIENSGKGKNSKINSLADIGYDTALFIGILQLIAAIFPGTSRLVQRLSERF